MKKMTFLACAAMLTSAVAFTGCNSNEQNNPQQKAEVVKTEFAISLPGQAVNGPRHMPSTTVQISGASEFQGIGNITLIPFATQADVTTSDSRLGTANITLTDIAATSELGTNSHAKYYSNVAVPLTTATMLFYGKSKAGGADPDKKSIGSLNAQNMAAGNPATIQFNLEPIVAAVGTPTGTGTSGEALINYLNTIAQATDGETEWRNYTAAKSIAMTAMFETFSTWHSLSSYSVASGLADLYASLAPLNTPIANAIKTAIDNNIYAEVSGTGTNVDPYVVTLNSTPLDLTNFPEEYGLPEGSVRIKFNTGTKVFQACTTDEYLDADNTPLDRYTYPAALWYFANSQLKTANELKHEEYDNTNTWSDILDEHTAAKAVNTLTRAVAIEDVIQYGVARLDVIVKLSGSTLDDNTPVTAQSISCSSYPVTAVLIGGQKNVGFDFKPIAGTEYTIYDHVMTGGSIAATTTNTAANSTLVLESEVGADKAVKIAIELQNASGKDFIGVDGALIPAGGKFYLVAELKATGAGKSSDVTPNQVFKQDYTTTATLTIGSLKSAYNTIPDLRTPELELGLSVDLNWTPGNTYDITIP